MKTKSLSLFFVTAVLSAGVILFGFVFVNIQTRTVELAEKTLIGNVTDTKGLSAGYRADAGETLHWTVSYDFASNQTTSAFKRGEMEKAIEKSIYEDFRFTGWSSSPYTTFIENPMLKKLQKQEIQQFYHGINDDVSGKIRLADYLDYYPVSFRFQFGAKIYNSDDALAGLKIYEAHSDAAGKASEYDEDVQLYVDLNRFFQIPVISNEHQKYQGAEGIVKIEPSLDDDEDYYQFDPIIALQEENLMDGMNWEHLDLAGSKALEKDGDYVGKTADQYNLKNRLLFIVNNRTAKGKAVDVSRLEDGYGIYELPIETRATASVRYGKRSVTVPNPKPLSAQLSMVYLLDEDAEYVEMTMSPDHRCLGVFFIKHGGYFVEFVDADMWISRGIFRMFDASTKMTYAWGEDGSLAATNFQDEIAVFTRVNSSEAYYHALYCGSVPKDFDQQFFDELMTEKAHSYGKYQCRLDEGLAIAGNDDKVAFAQNSLIEYETFGIRDASLQCAVVDKQGILYWGNLESDIKDSGMEEKSQLMDNMILPVRNENWVRWE